MTPGDYAQALGTASRMDVSCGGGRWPCRREPRWCTSNRVGSGAIYRSEAVPPYFFALLAEAYGQAAGGVLTLPDEALTLVATTEEVVGSGGVRLRGHCCCNSWP